MKTAKPTVSAAIHKTMKREAQKRGMHMPNFYDLVLSIGLNALKLIDKENREKTEKK